MFSTIRNFVQCSESLFCGGMPTIEQMKDAPNHGVEVVINLAPDDSEDALLNEAELARSLGMKYIHIPVLWSAPAREAFDKFMCAMDENKGRVIFVHCEANYRASCFIALYRILRMGWGEENALSVMRQVWNENNYPAWKTFIEKMIKRVS